MDSTGTATETFKRSLSDAERVFRDEVFPAELQEINRSRIVRKLPPCPVEGSPSPQKGLVGLALSGGGVRSASVSIGVLQALVSLGILNKVDYLSSVSGGGYAGSCLSSILNQPGATPEVLREPSGEQDTPVIRQLRNCANYLTSYGPGTRFRLPMVVFRGIVTNLMLALPVLILAVLITEVVLELWHMAGGLKINPITLLGLVFVPMILHPPILRIMRVLRRRLGWRERNGYELLLSRLLVFSVVLLGLLPVLWLVQVCVDQLSMRDLERFLKSTTFEHDAALGAGVILCVAALNFARHLRWLSQGARIVSRLAVGILGPLLFFAVYLLGCVAFVESPYVDRGYEEVLSTLSRPEVGKDLARTEDQLRDLLNGKGFRVGGGETHVTVASTDAGWRVQYHPVGLPAAAKSVDIIKEPHCLYIPERSIFHGYANWWFYFSGLAILVLNLLVVDVNMTSSHMFYRDRLSKAFLFRREPDGTLVQNDDQRLSDLNEPGTGAPYHLINTTLNLQASLDPNLRGRRADFFVFSKRYSGGKHTGYVDTRKVEATDSGLNLGTAMAISAAAAAPNMGVATQKFLVFIMTILNLRLGYWAPNPRALGQPAHKSLLQKILPNVGPWFLWKEATGNLDSLGSHVNLSDGGHLENLAIYELLRRRCRLIIAVDAEADPNHSFQGMVTLMRFARIDLGIQIGLNLDEIRKNSEALSKSHWAIGTIDYGLGRENGHLIYLKSSLTGDETEYLRAYSRDDDSFPHTATSNQFFDETQFEVYRALGEHIALATFSDAGVARLVSSVTPGPAQRS